MERLSQQSIPDCRLITRNLPQEHAYHQSKNGRFSIQAKAWVLLRKGEPISEFRIVLIEGSANTILNTWAFPFAPRRLPVFAAELIAMAGLPRLTFMDIQIPGASDENVARTRKLSSDIRRAYDDLVCREEPPKWAIDASGGDYLFSRSGNACTFPRIQQAYLSLLDAYLALAHSPRHIDRSRDQDRKSIEELHSYQHHHMLHSPGRTFLGKVFGEHWTDDFLTNFLFTLPGA